jgi:hypothetical protein
LLLPREERTPSILSDVFAMTLQISGAKLRKLAGYLSVAHWRGMVIRAKEGETGQHMLRLAEPEQAWLDAYRQARDRKHPSAVQGILIYRSKALPPQSANGLIAFWKRIDRGGAEGAKGTYDNQWEFWQDRNEWRNGYE